MPASCEGPKAEAENAKQIITLSTGAVAFTVTFLDNFKAHAEGTPVKLPTGLYVAWVLFGLTVGFALWYLMALTGNISAIGRRENGWTLDEGETKSANGDESNTRLPGLLMVGCFFLAVISLIWLGFALADASSAPPLLRRRVLESRPVPRKHLQDVAVNEEDQDRLGPRGADGKIFPMRVPTRSFPLVGVLDRSRRW